jgi:hypothetical protein
MVSGFPDVKSQLAFSLDTVITPIYNVPNGSSA